MTTLRTRAISFDVRCRSSCARVREGPREEGGLGGRGRGGVPIKKRNTNCETATTVRQYRECVCACATVMVPYRTALMFRLVIYSMCVHMGLNVDPTPRGEVGVRACPSPAAAPTVNQCPPTNRALFYFLVFPRCSRSRHGLTDSQTDIQTNCSGARSTVPASTVCLCAFYMSDVRWPIVIDVPATAAGRAQVGPLSRPGVPTVLG